MYIIFAYNHLDTCPTLCITLFNLTTISEVAALVVYCNSGKFEVWYMHSLDGWMDGWVDLRIDGWMDESFDGWVDSWMDKWMDGWMDGWVDVWHCMDRWMGIWTDAAHVDM